MVKIVQKGAKQKTIVIDNQIITDEKMGSAQSLPAYDDFQNTGNQYFKYEPDRKKIMLPRWKNLRIYAGANNLKRPSTYEKGEWVFIADPSKEWYVTYQFLDERTGKYVPRFERRGLNYIRDPRKKMMAAEELLRVVEQELKANYNPLANRYESHKANSFSKVGDYPFKPALEWALEKGKGLSKSTISTYKTNIKYLAEALDRVGYGSVPVKLITKGHISEALDELPGFRQVTEAGINHYITNLKTLFGVLVKKDVLQHNPMQYIEALDEDETEGHVPPTDEELKTIVKELKKAPVGYRLYIDMFYQTTIRPKELTKLQVEEIDFENLYVNLKRTNEDVKEKTKTRKLRRVPITIELAKELKKYIGTAPGKWFVFGRDFKCSEFPLHRNRYSAYWKEIIKDRHGIDKNMYGMKKRAADDLINDTQADSESVGHLMGHSSVALVRSVYNKKKTVYDKRIRENTKSLFD